MSANSKLNILTSPRYTRAMKKKVGELLNPTSECLPDGVQRAEMVKVAVKKRPPIKIEYENRHDKKMKISVTENKKTSISAGWEPKDWRVILANIQEMRKNITAPGDEIERHNGPQLNATLRFQTLIGTMLSSQTKQEITHAAMNRLRAHGCTPANIKQTPDDVLGKLIHPVGLWKRKVLYIKKTVDILLEQYAGDIPRTVDDLCKLPGVGPKVGHLCMQLAWGKVCGIVVDTHVHRLSNRFGWVQKPTKIPEETRAQLESWLPKEEWFDINRTLVVFGQTICNPVRPKCFECLNKDICPYSQKNITNK